MATSAKSIRAFIGAKNYKESQEFYKAMGFTLIDISPDMCVIKVNEQLSFYLQDAYVKDWINNSMLFLELDDLDAYEKQLKDKDLTKRFKTVRFTKIKEFDWGREFFMHDPSGVLWHFGVFNV